MLDAISDLSKGKKSNLKIGSRSTPHRLRQEERKLLEAALKKGFLEVQPWSRVNLINIYKKICHYQNTKAVICQHNNTSSSVMVITNADHSLTDDGNMVESKIFETKQEAKLFVKGIVASN